MIYEGDVFDLEGFGRVVVEGIHERFEGGRKVYFMHTSQDNEGAYYTSLSVSDFREAVKSDGVEKPKCTKCGEEAETTIGKMWFCRECMESVGEYVYGEI